MAREYSYPAVVSNEYEGGLWVANFVNLTGCWTEGADRDDVVRRAPEALSEWLKSCLDAGWPVPQPPAAEELRKAQLGEVIIFKVKV